MCEELLQADAYATGLSRTDISMCSCDPNYYFDTAEWKCVRTCNLSEFAVRPNPANASQCICLEGFGWRSSDSKCIKNCSKGYDPNAASLSATDIFTCVC